MLPKTLATVFPFVVQTWTRNATEWVLHIQQSYAVPTSTRADMMVCGGGGCVDGLHVKMGRNTKPFKTTCVNGRTEINNYARLSLGNNHCRQHLVRKPSAIGLPQTGGGAGLSKPGLPPPSPNLGTFTKPTPTNHVHIKRHMRHPFCVWPCGKRI